MTTGNETVVADTDQEISLVDRLRLGGPNAWEVYGEAADEIERWQSRHYSDEDYRSLHRLYVAQHAEIERLQTRLEEVALLADVCISHDLGRPCSYCECDGKNPTT